MLTANAVIKFTLENKSYNVKPFRVAFNFGEGLLFTGEIISDHDIYSYNKPYKVNVDFFTIEEDSYSALKRVLLPKMGVVMQAGSRILGTAELSNFKYNKLTQ